MIKTAALSDLSDKKKFLLQVENIFFQASSKKEFSSSDHKSGFFKKWCGDYIQLFPQEFFLMIEGDHVLGYLSGCSDSLRSLKLLTVPGLEVFSDLYQDYPAHLHINFHEASRGRGLGSELIKTYITFLKTQNVKGLHLITTPEAPNVSFYRKLGFRHEVQREFNGTQLLFMGTYLSDVGGNCP